MPEIIGELPHPRILIHGFEADSALVSHVRKIAPTVRLIDRHDLSQVRKEEWDALVILGEMSGPKGNLNIFQVGGEGIGRAITAGSSGIIVTVPFTTTATHFILPDDLNSDVRTLSRNDLLPLLQTRPSNAVWGFWDESNKRGYPRLIPESWDAIDPFLMDADRGVLAGRIRRGTRDTWWLPDVGCDLPRWFSAALSVWSLIDPEAFPVREEWKKREAWKTPAEIDLGSQSNRVQGELAAMITQLAQEQGRLALAADEMSTEVDENERRLLTAQGGGLVTAVQAALVELGFTVTDADQEVSAAGDKREDLRVTDPSVPDWTAIVEVRGYARGAQLNDLLRLGRFVTRFVRETGREPSSVWYVVNQEIKKDPDTRQVPLASNREEVATFAETGGAVFDTRDIFRLLMRFRTREINDSQARSLLREATGNFSLDSAIGHDLRSVS
ncbi:hypothetical protein [Streptomyces sp. NPDC047990]|uniref:hypothetical protein n=1 Tax=Streptomyces sp. NPDC047990 TaxID=3365496 RepID=UPI003719B986